MKLFFANCTNQIREINFRMVEEEGRGFSTQPIPMARQEMIANEDLSKPQIDYIINQQRRYGAVGVEDLDRVRKYYVPLIYSVDKPVPHDIWQAQMERNKGVKREEGSKLRKDAALATSHGMREYSPQAADNLSISVEEEKTGTMDHGGDQPLAEGYRMTREDTF